MNLYQLKIEQINDIEFDKNIVSKLKEHKVKYEISNSGRTISLIEQTVLSTNKNAPTEVAMALMLKTDDLLLTRYKGILTLKFKLLTKLIIDHDIVLDVYDDNSDEDIVEISEYLKSISVYFKVGDGNVITIFGQKCNLEFDHINEIITLLSYGANETYMYQYCDNRYGISQRHGYQKYLQ